MSHEITPGDFSDDLTERIILSLGRMGRNMENSLRYERQLRERHRLKRLSQPLPEQEAKPPHIYANEDYEIDVVGKAPSLEAAADTVLRDAKRAVIIGGRRTAAVGLCLLLFWRIAADEEATAKSPEPIQIQDMQYDGAARLTHTVNRVPHPLRPHL